MNRHTQIRQAVLARRFAQLRLQAVLAGGRLENCLILRERLGKIAPSKRIFGLSQALCAKGQRKK